MFSCYTDRVGYHHNKHVSVSISRCFRKGAVMHEVLHALGFWHEQNRPDRDNFVTIHFDNIIPSASIFIMFKFTSSVYNKYNNIIIKWNIKLCYRQIDKLIVGLSCQQKRDLQDPQYHIELCKRPPDYLSNCFHKCSVVCPNIGSKMYSYAKKSMYFEKQLTLKNICLLIHV